MLLDKLFIHFNRFHVVNKFYQIAQIMYVINRQTNYILFMEAFQLCKMSAYYTFLLNLFSRFPETNMKI